MRVSASASSTSSAPSRSVRVTPTRTSGLADAWSLLSSYGLVDPREGMPRARDAANRALMLDATLARAHTSLARTAMIFDWDWPTAEWHFDRAIALDAGDALTHQWYAYLLSALGRHDEAIAEVRRAVAAEPRSLNTNTALGYVLYVARRYDEAATELSRTLEIDPDFAQARRNLALVRVQQHRIGDAVAALERVVAINRESPMAMGELAWARALNGERAEAARLLAELDTLRGTRLRAAGGGGARTTWAWEIGMRPSRGCSAPLRCASPHSRISATEPIWDGLRNDPRVGDLLSSIRTFDPAPGRPQD